MTLRDKISQNLKEAMRSKDAVTLGTLRLINAAIKDRDITLRAEGRDEGARDDEVLAILSKMVKQRQESAAVYEDGGRLELAEKEREEIAIIEAYLPAPLSAYEVDAAISSAIEATGATGLRDMGKVMGALKSQYTGQIDFGAVGPKVKDRLS